MKGHFLTGEELSGELLRGVLERALELSPDLKSLPSRGPQLARMMKTARVLEGLARHASTHAAGVLITPGPLLDYVPLYRQKDETVTTQWDMKSIEKAGLLKMDFLGLRTLSVLDESVRLVERTRGVPIDLRDLPMDDAAAYQVFQESATVAIFQFESGGMRDYLKRLKPTVFEDLVAMNALYRPGPMENIPYFIDCKHGKQSVRYEHSDLEPILRDTYGVFVYQEQVMQAANALAGFSMAQADELRRAMGKKRPEEMEAKRKEFVEGCRHRKITPAKAEKIFATMEKFAGYGFNKCVVGDTTLIEAKSGERITVESLFRERRPFTIHALGEDWRLRSRRVTDVVWNGRKPVFELRTAQGKTIQATGNHPFRTLDGWKDLEDLRAGDRIAAPRSLQVEARNSWPEHEVITLAGLLSEGNTCHPTTLYFYGNDRALVDDFVQAISCFPDTEVKIYRRREGKYDVAANLGRAGYAREGDVLYGDAFEGNLAVVLDAPELAAWGPAEEAVWIAGPSAVPGKAPPRPSGSRLFSDTGYFVARTDDGSQAILDVGPHGYRNGGHAHADARSCVLSVQGRPLLIDPGTSTYTMDPALRDRMRSPVSHNTVTIDGRSHSTPAGPFHWRSTTDAQPVFEAIAERAAILSNAKFAFVTSFDGELIHMRSSYGPGAEAHRVDYPMRPGAGSIAARVVRDRSPVEIEDMLADAEYVHKKAAMKIGFRSGFGVPIDGGIVSRSAFGSSSFAMSFCSASLSKSADSPPQKMSASGLPFHSTMRPYETGVPAWSALVLTVTPHFSFAYVANAFRAASTTSTAPGSFSPAA